MNHERIATWMNCSGRLRGCCGWFDRLPQRIIAWWLPAVCVLLSAAPTPLRAQVRPAAPQSVIQVGLAAVPGAGLVAGYVAPRGFYTVGAMLYADATPSFSGGEGSLLVSLGLGGSIRPLGAARLIANAGDPGYDLDVGIRIGPSLFFPYGESSRKQNPFSLFLEPFVRVESTLGGTRTMFLEVGIQRPIFRGGVWMRL